MYGKLYDGGSVVVWIAGESYQKKIVAILSKIWYT